MSVPDRIDEPHPQETHIKSREQWLELRKCNVGASEVAALFGCQPAYAMSHYTLWHVKRGDIPEPTVDGERPAWGFRLEDAIAEAAAEKLGITSYRRSGYWRHKTVPGLGCTPDFICENGSRLLECKNVDWLVYRKQWDGEPPKHILLQAQTQMACTGADIVDVCGLVGGNDLKTFPIERRPKIVTAIEARILDFWESIANGKEPPIDDTVSTAETVQALFPHDNGDDALEDMRHDSELPNLCASLTHVSATRRDAQKEERRLKSLILAKMAHRRAGFCDGFTIRAVEVDPQPEVIVTAEMVGQSVGGRSGFRKVSVKEVEIG